MSFNQPSFSVPPATRWIVTLAGLATLALLCWLPYRVPLSPAYSDSYLFGYSNRAALALVGAFALFTAVLASRTGRMEPPILPDQPMPAQTLTRALCLTVALALPLHLIVRRTGGYLESSYFLDRIKLLLDGKVSYRDFEYAYGVSFLYLPAWLARGLHLPVADAYGIVWLIVSLSGIWMLFRTIQQVPAPGWAKRAIFHFLFAMSVLGLLCTGVNYSTFRFVLPLFFGLLLDKKIRQARSPAAQALPILLVVPCFLALLLVSPELSLAFAIGIVGYLAFFADLRSRSNLAAFALMLLLVGIISHVASTLGVFLTLNAFRSGGLNFPVMPAASILLFLVAIALTSIYAGIHVSARKGGPALVVIAISAATIAGALGRCDPGHILLNPLGLWICALALSASRPLPGRLALASCTLVFFLVPLTFDLRGVLVTPARAALLTLFTLEQSNSRAGLDHHLTATATRLYGPDKAGLKLDQARRFAQLHDGLDVARIFGYPPETIFNAPFQFSPEEYGPIHTPQVDTGYFYALINLVTPQEVQQKLAELAAHPERPLLLLPGAENSCAFSPEAEEAAIRKIFRYPYSSPVRNPASILDPICDFIRARYSLVRPATPDRLGYAVWERRSESAPTGPDDPNAAPRARP